MKLKRLSTVALIIALVALLLTASFAAANAPAKMAQSDQMLAMISEDTGMIASYIATSPTCIFDNGYGVYLCPEPEPGILPQRDPAAHADALNRLGFTGLLLVPESTNDRVMAFDPVTGDLIVADFIPSDPTNLSTPIQAILSASGDSVLVSDQVADSVEEYDLFGNWLGEFAGGNTAILDNLRGISLRSNGNLLVTVGSGSNANSIAEFDSSGTYLGNFVAIGSGGLNSPFDVFGRSSDWLVTASTSDAVHRYDLSGSYIADLTAVDNFPEQVTTAANANVLVADFLGTQVGVVEYTASGTLVDIYNPAGVGGNRGVYELQNGNILTTNGTGVYEIDRSGNLVDTKITGVSARFISFVGGATIEIEKSPDYQDVLPNGTAAFTISVTNTSSVSLTNVFVSDALTPDCDNTIGTMFPDTSVTYNCNNVGVTASFTNTAVVSSTLDGPGPTASDNAFVNVFDASLEIEKAPDLQIIDSGGTANFTITITNSGTVDLINVTVTDALVPSCDTVIATLSAGASSTHTCSEVGVTTPFTNTAVVTGTIDQGLPQPSAMDDAYVDIDDGPTAVSITDFGRNPTALSPIWLALILGVVLGFGLLLRRRTQS